MNLTVSKLAEQLQALISMGHADAVVCVDTHQPQFIGEPTGVPVTRVAHGKDWNHGRVLLWPEQVLQPVEGTASEPVICWVQPRRDEHGLWRHPAHPGLESERLNIGYLRDRGYDCCTNYLIPPDMVSDTAMPREWRMLQPAGDKWILWEIKKNTDGELIAVWIASTKKLNG